MSDPPGAAAAGTLHGRWRQQVDAAPGAPVLAGAEGVLTRAAFDALIETEARRLERAGIGHGDIVAWLDLNTPRMLAALFACSKLGAVWLPLNWRLADEELAAVLRHAGAKRLFAGAAWQDRAASLRAACAATVDTAEPVGVPGAPGALDAAEAARTCAAAPGAGHAAALATGVEPGDDLLLAYTSGTTGRPKGALHTHAAMLANADAAIGVQGLDERTRTLAVLPLFHVGGLCIQTLPTLLAGGQVRLHPRFEADAWLRDVNAWRPTTSLLVPAAMRMLVEHPAWAAADLSSLEFLNSGSSVVPVALIDAFHARGVPVAQVYGATETGPVSIALAPAEALANPGKAGRAAPGVEVRLIGHDGQPAPAGEVGEIVLRGANLMRGYHREPAGAGLDDGWFATGDLGRLGTDGLYEVVGRSKDMIISGGENIYPAEIESLLAGAPEIAECAVVGLPDARWGEVPVLAVVARPGETVDAEALVTRLRPRLAAYKLPRRVFVLDALPKTALGKVLKAALVEGLKQAD